MKIEEVKRNLDRMVRYKGIADIYRLTACTLRKNENGFFYQAELLDARCGTSVIICRLEEIEVIE